MQPAVIVLSSSCSGDVCTDQRRVELLLNVPVPLQQQTEELENVVRDKVHVDSAADAGQPDRLLFREQADSFFGPEDVNAA
jgi:hypothetical protein